MEIVWLVKWAWAKLNKTVYSVYILCTYDQLFVLLLYTWTVALSLHTGIVRTWP